MTSAKNVSIIAKEGYWHIFLAFLPFAFSVYGGLPGFLTFLCFILFVYTLFFFRNPERVIADDSIGSVLSPVDGIIEAIERQENGSGVMVRIRNGFFDTHVVRSPFNSMIKTIHYRHGMALFGDFEKAQKLNTMCEVAFEGLRMRVFTSLFPYQMRCYATESEAVRNGERIGYFYAGTVELYLPKNINLHVNIGDHVKSAENLIGIIKES